MEFVLAHPADSTFTVGVNQFSDLTWEEFQSGYLQAPLEGNFDTTPMKPISQNVDWKDHIQPVKNQGRCGSCWAFSALGSLEAVISQKTGKKINLAEQELVDCANAKRYFPNNGCHGGLMHTAFKYINLKGIAFSEDYPYKAKKMKCNRID